MKPALFSQKELDRERAKEDCVKYGIPTPGVDHSSHYKKIPYAKQEADKEKDNG